MTSSVTKLKVLSVNLYFIMSSEPPDKRFKQTSIKFWCPSRTSDGIESFFHYKSIECDCGINIGNMENRPKVYCIGLLIEQ